MIRLAWTINRQLFNLRGQIMYNTVFFLLAQRKYITLKCSFCPSENLKFKSGEAKQQRPPL